MLTSTVKSEEPRSTTASPPHSEEQSDWGLHGYLGELESEVDYTCSLGNEGADDYPSDPKVLCAICHKTLVPIQETALLSRRKRRRQDAPPLLSYMTVCDYCSRTDPSLLISASLKTKRVVKRQRAKTRNETEDSEALRKLKEQQQELLEKCKDLPENERKRMQQIIRNRISAQQSRDRKKLVMVQIEATNTLLVEENQQLRGKIDELSAENRYLRSQLERYTTDPAPNTSWPRAGALTLGLGAVVMIAMVLTAAPAVDVLPPQPAPRHLETSIMEYREPQSTYPPAIASQGVVL